MSDEAIPDKHARRQQSDNTSSPAQPSPDLDTWIRQSGADTKADRSWWEDCWVAAIRWYKSVYCVDQPKGTPETPAQLSLDKIVRASADRWFY